MSRRSGQHSTTWRLARNSFIHEGRAKIRGQEVDVAKAAELVQQANAIADWTEALLPPGEARPRYRGTVTWEFFKTLAAPEPAPAPPAVESHP